MGSRHCAFYAAAVLIILVFDEFTFHTDWEFVDDWSINQVRLSCCHTALFKFLRLFIAGNNTEVVSFNNVCSICDTYSKCFTSLDIDDIF